jgi:PAS domain S-box-containing protein
LRDYEREREHEQQLAVLRAMVETVPCALAIVWPNGELRVANWAFLRIGGPSDCSTLRKWVSHLEAQEGLADDLDRHLAQALDGNVQPRRVEVSFRSYAGNQVHWILTFQQLPDEVEGQPAVLVAGTDITEKKRLIDLLMNAKNQMENFLSAAAHDLKSPLITIAHNVTFAREGEGDQLTPETAECLDRIDTAKTRMATLLKQISDVSRAGRDTEPRVLNSLRDLAQEAVQQLEGVIADRGAHVILDDAMPKLRCQGTKIVEVFSNLISNAVHYTPMERSPHVQVGYQGYRDGEHVFFVRDNGCGIPEDCRQRVFGLFDRLCTDPAIPGQGIGLTIVRRVTELHGGRVWVESNEGVGSTFYFTIAQKRANHEHHDRARDNLLARGG